MINVIGRTFNCKFLNVISKRFGLAKVKCYFAFDYMRKNKKQYSVFQKTTSIFLMLTLFWLTISTPFVIAAQQEIAKQEKAQSAMLTSTDCDDENNEDGSNNSVEEKVPSTSNLTEEYLHEHHTTHQTYSTVISLYHKLENAATYTAFHGELLVPPPNIA